MRLSNGTKPPTPLGVGETVPVALILVMEEVLLEDVVLEAVIVLAETVLLVESMLVGIALLGDASTP